VPIGNVSGATAFAAGVSSLVVRLIPVAGIAGGIADRAQLGDFLLTNHGLVDEAIELMTTNSVTLYANVAVGTSLSLRRAGSAGQALVARRRDIRGLIANWTVLMDDTRRLLGELKSAIEHPDRLETRLRNLNESVVTARIDTSAIRKQIATLGTSIPVPQ
jgi:hypothetical protein